MDKSYETPKLESLGRLEELTRVSTAGQSGVGAAGPN
jgi:hypothetical protein